MEKFLSARVHLKNSEMIIKKYKAWQYRVDMTCKSYYERWTSVQENQFMVMQLISCFFLYGHSIEDITLITGKTNSAL